MKRLQAGFRGPVYWDHQFVKRMSKTPILQGYPSKNVVSFVKWAAWGLQGIDVVASAPAPKRYGELRCSA